MFLDQTSGLIAFGPVIGATGINARKLLLAAVMSFAALPALAQTSSTAEKNGHHYSGGQNGGPAPYGEEEHRLEARIGRQPPLWRWTQDRCTAPHGAKKGAVIVGEVLRGLRRGDESWFRRNPFSHPSVTETAWSSTRIALAPATLPPLACPRPDSQQTGGVFLDQAQSADDDDDCASAWPARCNFTAIIAFSD